MIAPAPDLVAEQPLQQILVERQRALREHRVSQLLELLENLVIQARIVMVRAREHHDADALLALRADRAPRAPAAGCPPSYARELAEPDLDRPLVFFLRQPEQRSPCVEQLLCRAAAVGEVDQRAEISDALLREDVAFLGERGLDRLGRHGDGRTRVGRPAGASASVCSTSTIGKKM